MSHNVRRLAVLALGLVLVSTALIPRPGFGQGRPQGQQRPPEYNELVTASQIKDAAARLKEFERIRAAYPQSQFMARIDSAILSAKIELADSLGAILALQKDLTGKSQGPARLQGPIVAADQIMSHPKLKSFDKSEVLIAILKYKDEAVWAAEDPGSYLGIPQDRQAGFKSQVLNGFEILAAQAYLNAGDTVKATASLEAYKKKGGTAGGVYYYTLAGVSEKAGRSKEAYEAYLGAAAESYEDAKERARELYIKINGKADGFEAALEARAKAVPFVPEPFKAPAGWKERTVLAELFTGSECPPCVAADLGFDGLIETYPVKYLAVLVYHLPIPRPDPMINAASKKRQEYYGVNSTPTVFIDGEKDATGGGSRGMAEGKFKQYRTDVDARLGTAPEATLKVKATRAGDALKVEFEPGTAVAGADYHVVLVQGEERYRGSNGLEFHQMVVRDLVTVDPAVGKTASFDLAASERGADQYLTDFETTNTRFQGFKFAERHHKIDRARLRVIFFAQDRATKKVLNAAVAAVK